jgi:hypothetical protein
MQTAQRTAPTLQLKSGRCRHFLQLAAAQRLRYSATG